MLSMSASLGSAPASVSASALRRIMNRIVVPRRGFLGGGGRPGGRAWSRLYLHDERHDPTATHGRIFLRRTVGRPAGPTTAGLAGDYETAGPDCAAALQPEDV